MSQDAPLVSELSRSLHETLFHRGTSMPRPPLLVDRIGAALARARRYNCSVVLLLLSDITTAGGSADLFGLGRTLQALVGVDDTIAPGPGDSTLIVVCNMVDSRERAQVMADDLLEKASIVCRVGLTFSDAADNATTFLARAFDGG